MSKILYDDDGLRLASQAVRKADEFIRHQHDVWYYKEKRGLYVVVHPEAYQHLTPNNTLAFIIPRKQILNYARVAESI